MSANNSRQILCDTILCKTKNLIIQLKKKNEPKNAEELSKRLYELHMERKGLKQKISRKPPLKKQERIKVLEKTGSKCHICGGKLTADKFQADHIESHCRGGESIIDNYLPSCFTCNNYRWHYLPEELHWILKLGVFAKTQIERKTSQGKNFAVSFIKKEEKRIQNGKKSKPAENEQQGVGDADNQKASVDGKKDGDEGKNKGDQGKDKSIAITNAENNRPSKTQVPSDQEIKALEKSVGKKGYKIVLDNVF
jgi:hypothetical protein